MERNPQYLVVCVPERMRVRDLAEYQANRLAVRESPHLVWCRGYLFEYVEEWSDKDPYIHYKLGGAYVHKYNETYKFENLVAARNHFITMLDLNEFMEEAEEAQEQIPIIDERLRELNLKN